MDFIYNGTTGATAFQLGFFAIVIFQIGFIILQAYFIRRVEYYYYILYMICIIPYFLSHNEEILNIPILFSNHPGLKLYFDKPLIILNFFTYINFSRNFLDIPAKYPAFNKVLTRIITTFVGLGCTGFLFYLYFREAFYSETIFAALYIGLFFTVIWILYKFFSLQQTRLNNFIILGAIFIVFGSMSAMTLFLLIDLGRIPGNIIPSIPSQICILLELLVFTTGLSYKTSLIEKGKIDTERLLVNELQEKEHLITDMHQMRTRIASDLHDDIGATLSSIGMYSNIGMLKPELVPEILNKISKASNEMVDHMSDIVWSINPSYDTFEKLTSRMYDFSLNFLSTKGIQFKCEISDEVLKLPVKVETRKNLFLLLKEAMHNIVKYAECTLVTLTLKQENNHEIMMTIKDNGKGFDASAIKAYNGNGLKNMKTRAESIKGILQIDSIPGNGTTITLKFSTEESPI